MNTSTAPGDLCSVLFEGTTNDFLIGVDYYHLGNGDIALAPVVLVRTPEGAEIGTTTLAAALADLAVMWPGLDVEQRCAEEAAEVVTERDADARQRWAEDRCEAGRYW